jgi:hypothetical protein
VHFTKDLLLRKYAAFTTLIICHYVEVVVDAKCGQAVLMGSDIFVVWHFSFLSLTPINIFSFFLFFFLSSAFHSPLFIILFYFILFYYIIIILIF